MSFAHCRDDAGSEQEKLSPGTPETSILKIEGGAGRGADLQLRIYDKSAEILHGGTKQWFYELWRLDEPLDVWRVEFQLLRPVLKQLGMNTLDELDAKLAGLWRYLTFDAGSPRRPRAPHQAMSRLKPPHRTFDARSPEEVPGDMRSGTNSRKDTAKKGTTKIDAG